MRKTRFMKILIFTLVLALCLPIFAACYGGEDVTEENSSAIETESESASESSDAVSEDSDQASSEKNSDEVSESVQVGETESDSETESESETEDQTFAIDPDECTKHSFRNRGEQYLCIKCGFVPSCYGIHPYIPSEVGHKLAACDICEKVEGELQDHQYAEKIDDGGDVWLYAFRCTTCKYVAYEQEVPYEINSFFSAGELSGIDTNKTFTNKFCFDMGTGYAGFTYPGGGSGTVVVVDNDSMDRESGHYLVLKLRLPKSQTGFTVAIKSVSAAGYVTMAMGGLRPGWVTVIVDMTKAVGENKNGEATGYTPVGDGEYYLGALKINGRVNSGESFDIAYAMLCDKLEEAEQFVAEEKQVYTYADIMNEAPEFVRRNCTDKDGNPIEHKIIANQDGTHTVLEPCYQCGLAAVENEPHGYVQMRVNGELTYACAVCEHLQYGAYVNKYFSAEDLASNAVTYFKVDKNNLISEDELSFARYTGKGTVAQVIFARNNSASSTEEEAAAFDVGKANMLLIRIRTNSPDVELNISVGTKNGAAWKMVRVPLTLTASGEWATYAINLANAIPTGYVADENGEYNITNLYFQIGRGEKGDDFTENVNIDVEFMAFVDEWQELQALVSDENVIRVNTSNKGNLVDVEEQKCLAGCVYGETVNGDKRIIACDNCGTRVKEYTVPASVKWYISGYNFAFGAVAYGNMNDKSTGLDTDNTFYGTLTAGTGGGDAVWSRYQRDYSWGVVSDSYAKEPINVGKSRYLVIKLRADTKGKNFELFISTTEKHGTERLPSEVDEANGKPATRPTTMGSAFIKPAVSATAIGEWGVYVLDLEGMLPEYWIADPATGDYIIDSFWITMSGESTFDLEYLAFVEDFAAIDELVDEDEIIFVDSREENAGYARLDPKTGKCSVHVDYMTETKALTGKTEYMCVCTSCNDVITSKTVLNEVEFFMNGIDFVKDYLTYSNITSHKAMLEDGKVYGQIKTSADAEMIYVRSASDFTKINNDMGTNINVGQSKYLVLRIRTSDNTKSFNYVMSTTGVDGYIEVKPPLAATENGKWGTYVINLAELAPDHWKLDSAAQAYIIDTMYQYIGADGERTVDIDYMAFAENWTEIDDIVDEETVIYSLNATDRTQYKTVYAANGEDYVNH